MGLYDFLDNRRTLWFVLGLVVALIVVTYFTAGVYREVRLQGMTYEWVNAPEGAEGSAYVWEKPCDEYEEWEPPPGVELEPLGGVYVYYNTFFRNRHYDKVLTISGKDGHFSKSTRNWKVTGALTIDMWTEKEGYHSVNASFFNKSKPNVLHIILTRVE